MRRGRLLAVLASAQLLIALDHNIVYVALPEIDAALGFEEGAEQWVVSAYALGFGGLLLAGGRIADTAGAERLLPLALGLHAVAALAAGAADSGAALIAARAAQGGGSALLFPATLAILNSRFHGDQRARALAIWGAAGACGGAFGSLFGGALVDFLGWRSVPLCIAAVAGVTAAAAVRVLPPGATGGRGVWLQAPSALAGTCAAALALLALGQGLAGGWPAPAIVVCMAAAAAAAAAFWSLERRAREPLIPPAMLRNRAVGAATIMAFAFMASFGGQFYLLTVHLQETLGLSATAAGVAFLPLTVATLAGTQVGGALLTRAGARGTALAGALLGASGLAGCGLAVAAGSNAVLVPALVVDGLGQGVMWSGIWALAGEGSVDGQGVGNGVVATAQQLGGAAGVALWVMLAQTTASFLAAAGLVLVAAAAAAARTRPLVLVRSEGRDGVL
jgi:MFS family permease